MATVKKRTTAGGAVRYDVRYRDDEGAQRKETFTKKALADKRAAEVETDLNRGVYLDPKAGDITFAEFYETWSEAQTWGPSSREEVESRFRLHILPVLGPKKLRDIRPLTIDGLAAGWIKKGLAASTAKILLGHVKAIFAAAVRDRRIPASPAGETKGKKVVKKEVQRWSHEWVAAMDRNLPGRFNVLVEIGASLGLRIGEAAALGPDNVDFLRRIVTIDTQVGLRHGNRVFALPKGGKERKIPLPNDVAFALARHIQQWGVHEVTLPWDEIDGEPTTRTVFVTTETDQAISASNFSEVWALARRKSGIPADRRNGYHALRHYFASNVLHNGGDIVALSEYLGHHSAAFTLSIYAHFMESADDRMREAMDRAAELRRQVNEAADELDEGDAATG